MKKFIATSLLALSLSFVASAQYYQISPTEGQIDLNVHESGISSICFFVSPEWTANRSANVFAELYFNDTLISMVPASNSQLLKYDSIMDHNWCVSFFRKLNQQVMNNGEYRVVLQEGLFINKETQELSEELTLRYYIKDDLKLTITPTPGKLLKFQDVEIVFENCTKVVQLEDAEYPIDLFSRSEETATGENEFYYPVVDIDGNVVTLYFSNENTTRGNWVLSIPEGNFELTMDDGSVIKNPDIMITYTIPNILGGVMPTIDPAPGDISYFPGEIIIQLPEGQSVNFVGPGGSYIYTVDEDGNRGDSIARYQGSKDPWDDSVVILTNINRKDGVGLDVKAVPGNYVLVTAESLYSIKGNKSNQSSMEFEYTVVGKEADAVITPDPNEIHESIKEIAISFPNAENVSLDSTTAAWFASPMSSYIFYPSVNTETKTFYYRTEVACTVPGNYVLQVPANAFNVDGEYISQMPKFKIGKEDSVQSVVLPDIFNIVSIDGRLVKRNATNLDNLDKGIYIVAGKKVLIK